MPSFKTNISVGPIVCSRESFVEFVRKVAEQCNALDQRVTVSLTLKKEVRANGTYTVEELLALDSIDEARRLDINVGSHDSSASARFVLRDGLLAFRVFYLEASSRSELDGLVELVKWESRKRRPWWWLAGTFPAKLISLLFLLAGAVTYSAGSHSGAILLFSLALFSSGVGLLCPTFRIGASRRTGWGKSFGLWLLNSVASGFIGAAIAVGVDALRTQ